MTQLSISRTHIRQTCLPVLLSVFFLASCSAPVPRPTGATREYEDAKDMFKRGRLDRALEFTEGQATSSPPTKFTERARVLRAVIFTGMLKGHKLAAESYTKGAEKTKNSQFRTAYERQRNDNLQYGARAALGLAEVAHQMTALGDLPKEVTLEATYPSAEGPVEVAQFAKVVEGGWIEPDQQEIASADAQRKGINDALAEIVGGDRSKARTALAAGPVKIDGLDFALFLGKQLLEGASIFDRKHSRDSQKLRVIANEAEAVAKAAVALLKENPNKDKEKSVKKLQDQIKTALKNM